MRASVGYTDQFENCSSTSGMCGSTAEQQGSDAWITREDRTHSRLSFLETVAAVPEFVTVPEEVHKVLPPNGPTKCFCKVTRKHQTR